MQKLLGVLLVAHRYLAIAVGALMTLWCLSGFVMMYQGYPRLTEAERIAGLAPLDFTGCCRALELPFADDAQAPEWRVEMLLDKPVLRVAATSAAPMAATFDLTTGARVPELSVEQVRQVAAEYAARHGLGAAQAPEPLEIDQWTIQTARRYRPIYRVELAGAGGSEIYVSGSSGEVFQDTSSRERTLSWLGAIPHWLYPTVLRRDGELWSEVVVWTSLLGTFLTVTGLYVGIARLRRRRDGRFGSPFRGLWYWHHISGLVFGVLTLTWVFSGLLTMNPWGTLVGTGALEQIGTIKGNAPWRDVKQFLERVSPSANGAFVQISSAVFDGRLHAVALGADGVRTRLDSAGQSAPLRPAEIDGAVARLGTRVAEARLLDEEDSYYYRHKNDAELPVYRVVLDDAERTRLYVNPVTGSMRGVDATMRASRWLRVGLHDLDFAGLRVRPVWDIVVGLLLLGVTITCGIGTWLALRRLRRDFLWVRRTLAARGAPSPARWPTS